MEKKKKRGHFSLMLAHASLLSLGFEKKKIRRRELGLGLRVSKKKGMERNLFKLVGLVSNKNKSSLPSFLSYFNSSPFRDAENVVPKRQLEKTMKSEERREGSLVIDG